MHDPLPQRAREDQAAAHKPAVIANPTKVDPDSRRTVTRAIVDVGWPEPSWSETTEDDPGGGQVRAALDDGADLIMSLGGDGTVRACAAALAGTEVPLALLPAGTGNLLAKNLSIPDGIGDAVDTAARGQRRRIDVLDLDGELFAVMGGCGFDAELFENTSDPLKDRVGWAAYVVAGIQTVRRTQPQPVLVVIDEHRQRHHAVGIIVGNAGQLTGGVQLLPEAELDDGLLDVAILKTPRLRDWAGLSARLLTGRPPRPWQMTRQKARNVTIHWDAPMATELDGELLAERRVANFSVRPQALTVCVPAANQAAR
jgi:YegS/Rv2252/BmrU family lipid kinase